MHWTIVRLEILLGEEIKLCCMILFQCIWKHISKHTYAHIHAGLCLLLCPWGFSRQEYWSGLPSPPPGDLPNPGVEPSPVYLPDPGIELGSLALQADSLPATKEAHVHKYTHTFRGKYTKTFMVLTYVRLQWFLF